MRLWLKDLLKKQKAPVSTRAFFRLGTPGPYKKDNRGLHVCQLELIARRIEVATTEDSSVVKKLRLFEKCKIYRDFHEQAVIKDCLTTPVTARLKVALNHFPGAGKVVVIESSNDVGYNAPNITATPLNNAQPWRLFFSYFPTSFFQTKLFDHLHRVVKMVYSGTTIQEGVGYVA